MCPANPIEFHRKVGRWNGSVWDGDGIHGAADDPDRDGLDNLGEFINGTDPFNADTDGDGRPDGWEVGQGFDPVEIDTDGDGMSDWWERRHGITAADELKEMDPGGYVCVCTNHLTPIKLTLKPAGLPGKLTLSATMGGDRIRIWKDAGRAVEVVLTNGCAQVAPGTLYVEGVTNSAALRDVELRLEYDENPQGQSNPLFKCEDRIRLTVIKVDLDIWNGGSDLDNGQSAGSQGAQVPEGSEVLIGAYVLVNWDDDDADGTMNADGTWSALPVPDLTENSVANEDNLAKLKPTVEPLLDIGSIELEVSGADADKVKLWTQSTKGTDVALASGKRTWNLASPTEKADFQTFMSGGYWIEGVDAGTVERGVTYTLRYKNSGGTEICKDENKATVVMINLANAVYRDNMIWSQGSRGHGALVWRYAGTCTRPDLTNDVNFILIEMDGPTDYRTLATITQQAGYPAYGCFRNPSITHVQRLRIIQAARALAARAPITYTATDAVQPYDWDGALNSITALRCDSLIEVCYEINGVNVWGMERDADSHTVHYPINDQADNWSYNATWGTWTVGANNRPDNLEEHNDFGAIGWDDTFMPATQCGNVAPVEADTRFQAQNLCQPVGSTGGN
ncbi:MAG: hypothetical protein ACOX5G_13975 [Kiritimatiellia bacterium]|jgi:hypothetical protein